MPDSDGPGIGELSRQVREVLLRFEGLATRLETQFVRSDNFKLYQQLIDQAISTLQTSLIAIQRDMDGELDKKADKTGLNALSKKVDDKAGNDVVNALRDRVTQLEDDKKWLVRLVFGFIILAVLGLVVASQQGV